MSYKYYRILDKDPVVDIGNLNISDKLFSITGYRPSDYIQPVVKGNGKLVTIISDESEFKGHFASSLVAMPYLDNGFQLKLEEQLELLVKKYGICGIHLTEIFGKRRVLRNRESDFFEEYVRIVSQIPLLCLSVSISRASVERQFGMKLSNEDIYYAMFWTNIERVVPALGNNCVIHLWNEQEYSMGRNASKVVVGRIFEKLRGGIRQLYERNPTQYISICKHPQFFSKKALLFSSLADLVAYGSSKLQNKIDNGIPIEKIEGSYDVILRTIKGSFQNYSGLCSRKLMSIIGSS